MSVAIWWIRRDLRLEDNQALTAALATHDAVVPIMIKDPDTVGHPFFSQKRALFLFDGMRALDGDLKARGSYFVRREGRYEDVLRELCAETGADAIYAETEYAAFDRARDQRVAETLPLHLVDGCTIRHPNAIEKKAGGFYTVFTPYKKTWLNQPLPHEREILPVPERIPTPAGIASIGIPPKRLRDIDPNTPYIAGETAAQKQLTEFIENGLYQYNDERNMMARTGTSSLSPHIRWGMISARQAAVSALNAIAKTSDAAARKNAHVWLSELIWRDFYQMVLHHHPHVVGGSFRPEYDRIAWRNDTAEFEAWCAGRTGYPVVDAAMRQLKQTGWMHNRARMIVAAFLTKDLLIDWRWGEQWFMQQLLDGDVAANNGGWQWSAGTGTDAAPYFRIFNPWAQSKKFDPNGVYIRRWVSELADVPDKLIHEPHLMKPITQKLSHCVIGVDYPAPIVDHKMARVRALAVYKQARGDGDEDAVN